MCKYGEFPIGHPTIITENFEPISATRRPYKGMIRCRILPPRGLFHPVLPYRTDKLMFPLCATCADTRNNDRCTHTDEERQLCGTWPSCEIYKALELGYTITEMIEVSWRVLDSVTLNFAGLPLRSVGAVQRHRR